MSSDEKWRLSVYAPYRDCSNKGQRLSRKMLSLRLHFALYFGFLYEISVEVKTWDVPAMASPSMACSSSRAPVSAISSRCNRRALP